LSSAITASSVIARDEEAVSCDLAGGAALLDLRSGTYFSLNPVGAYVWELLKNPVAVSDIHTALSTRYDVQPDACYSDLVGLLEELAKAGLIRIADAAGG
jgi:Coenzyme PQQ synthesis protein D (PqqD)